MSDKLKIMSLNVRGLCNLKKRRSIFNWCRKSAGDIFFSKKPIVLKKMSGNGNMNGEGNFFSLTVVVTVEGWLLCFVMVVTQT